MNSPLIEEYLALTNWIFPLKTIVLLLTMLLVAAATYVVTTASERKKGTDKNETRALALHGAIVLGTFGGLFLGLFTSIGAGEIYNANYVKPVLEEVTDEINTTYKTDVTPEKVREAFLSGSDDVTLTDAIHDGTQKSLGININEETKKVTVYEGNVALAPAN